jgi:ethanolamine ammonia-lyase small subunit
MTARDGWEQLRAFTPARVALGRSGDSLPTTRVLEFQLAHARARDAVHTRFDAERVAGELGRKSVILESQAADRTDYLANPQHGRELAASSRARLQAGTYDAAVVIADGLSATAVHAHAAGLARTILAALPRLAWSPTTIVRNGRVAIGDDIADALGAEMVAVLIGERPGLSSADSLGIYLTFRPRPGTTTDADRNCISNVRPDGLPLADATHRLAWLMTEARRLKLTGVGLKEDAPEAALPGMAPLRPDSG